MKSYKHLLDKVISTGEHVPTRATLPSTGQRVGAMSVFGVRFEHWLTDGFPLLTTKRVFFRGVKEELAWMLRGETNSRILEEKGVNIWKGNADKDGELGPIYGKQWRAWEGPTRHVGVDPEEFDQVENLCEDIRMVAKNPEASVGRRLILSAWNVGEIDRMKLPPCHTMCQFSVRPGLHLDCLVTMRSCDLILGFPFNLAQYALLTHLLAKVTGTTAHRLCFSFGDLHIYDNLLEQAQEQMTRETRKLPTLEIRGEVDKSLRNIDTDNILIHGYDPHPALPGEMAV